MSKNQFVFAIKGENCGVTDGTYAALVRCGAVAQRTGGGHADGGLQSVGAVAAGRAASGLYSAGTGRTHRRSHRAKQHGMHQSVARTVADDGGDAKK